VLLIFLTKLFPVIMFVSNLLCMSIPSVTQSDWISPFTSRYVLQFRTRDIVKFGNVQTLQFRIRWSRNLFLHVLLVTSVTSLGTADSFSFKQHTLRPWKKGWHTHEAVLHCPYSILLSDHLIIDLPISKWQLFIQIMYPSHSSKLWAVSSSSPLFWWPNNTMQCE